MDKTSTNNGMVVGLDIGTTKIATVIGFRNDNGQIEVVGYGKSESSGVEFGEIKNILKTTEGITLSKDIATQRSNQEIESVYAGIAGHHIKTSKYNHILYRHGLEEPISKEEIEQLKKDVFKVTLNPGEEIIDVIPQRYQIDHARETLDPVGELGNEVIGLYQIITGNEREISKIVKCVNDAGLEVRDIVLEPIASGLACLNEDEKKEGVVLVDIGGGTTDMVIFVDGNPVFSKVIPIGGNIITKDISQVCHISEDVAEQLKIRYGTCVVEKSNANNIITIPRPYGQDAIQISEYNLAQIIYCRVQEEIINIVKNEIENSGYKDRLFAGLVLTGGGANLRNIRELCQFSMQLPVRIGVPGSSFAHNIPSELKHPMFATALGLLKFGIETENITAAPADSETKEATEKSGNGLFGGKRKKEPRVKVQKEKDPNKINIFEKIPGYLKDLLESIS